MQTNVNWRQVWNAMHDLFYKRIEFSDAARLAALAGLKPWQAVALCNRTCVSGYEMSRSIPE